MQRTIQAIQEANTQGRLGLLIYSVPNFPSPTLYKESLKMLLDLPFVSAIETTLPVTGEFSEHANPLIRDAHRSGASFNQNWTEIIKELPDKKPVISVLYKESATKIGFDVIMKSAIGKFDAVLLEWSEPKESVYSATAEKYEIDFIRCIGPWMNVSELEGILSTVSDRCLIYLMSAPMTGAELFPNEQLQDVIKKAKVIRPNCKIAAGFGVCSPLDIQKLAKVTGLDAVIVGTEFLRQLQLGVDSATIFLNSLAGALRYE